MLNCVNFQAFGAQKLLSIKAFPPDSPPLTNKERKDPFVKKFNKHWRNIWMCNAEHNLQWSVLNLCNGRSPGFYNRPNSVWNASTLWHPSLKEQLAFQCFLRFFFQSSPCAISRKKTHIRIWHRNITASRNVVYCKCVEFHLWSYIEFQ